MRKPSPKYARIQATNLVATELLKQGFWVSTKPQNQKFHILCANADITQRIGIRVVKSNTSAHRWTLHEEVEKFCSDDLFYVFVGYKNTTTPELFVVPSKIVLDSIREDALRWLSSKKRDGTARKNIHTRKFVITNDEKRRYLHKWHLLGLK